MKNKKKLSLLLALALGVTPVLTSVNQSKSFAEEKLKVDLRDANYLNDLISKNKYLADKVDELKKNNFQIDKTVRTIKGVDFVYYSNFNNTIVGLIQIHKDLNSEIRMNLVDSELNTIEFIKEDGNKKIIGKDENGQFNKILFETETVTNRSAWWCPYVVGLVGTSISSLYTTVAAAIGGPIAAIIVAGVSSVGWTYVSSKCD